jgi:hypothetical protein
LSFELLSIKLIINWHSTPIQCSNIINLCKIFLLSKIFFNCLLLFFY